jgi:hypothetical protein
VKANETFVSPDPAGGDVCAWATAHAQVVDVATWSLQQKSFVYMLGLVCTLIGLVGYMITLLVFHRFSVDYAQPSLIYHKVGVHTVSTQPKISIQSISWLEVVYTLNTLIYYTYKLSTGRDGTLDEYMNIPRVALSRAVDLLTLCTTLDRLLAIHCPLRWREWNKRRVAITIVVCASLLAGATALVDVFGGRVLGNRSGLLCY